MEKETMEKWIKESKTINEVLRKMGKNDSSGAYKLFKRNVIKYNIDISHFSSHKEIIETQFKNGKIKKLENNFIFIENSTVSRHVVKKRIIKENLIPYSCNFCGNNGYWINKKISLILDHINGYNNDNRIENLRFLCPNCNATLTTHCLGHKGYELEESKNTKTEKKYEYKPRLNTRKVERPNINLLLDQVNSLGYKGTGKIYNVSDVSIRKWIKWASNRS